MVVRTPRRLLKRAGWRSLRLLTKAAEAAGAEARTLTDIDGRPAGARFQWLPDEPGLLRGAVKSFAVDGVELRFFIEEELDWIQRHHRRGEFYESEELAIIAREYKSGVFVDVGANVGNHSIYVAKLLHAPAVIAFEPVPLCAEILAINIALNHCQDVVELRRVGLSDRPGKADASGEPYNLGATRLETAADGPIGLVKGDDLLASTSVGFIKIDTEGFELKVLEGLRSTIARCRPPLFVEVENDNIEPFRSVCDSSGYRVAEEFRRYPEATNFLAVPS
jgi:FkbM family methyltransferase